MGNKLRGQAVSFDGIIPAKWWAWLLFFCLICTTQAAAIEEKQITNQLDMTFIRVEPGTFLMGSPATEEHRTSNETQHQVHIKKSFYLQQKEVTLEQWQAVMGKSWFIRREGSDQTPVTRVSFYDVQKFIRKLNKTGRAQYRLPSEAEWEYACRAGTTTAYSWGNDIDCSRAMYANNPKKLCDCCAYYRSAGLPVNGPAPVGSFAPNPWGFYDMHGNVWEWCADAYTDDIRTPGVNTYDLFSSRPRVRRGGSWYKYGQFLRSANRTYAHPGARFQTTGFRLVRETD
ncbi:MAG: formylglycine-generating enzyme family protein [Desulfotignum sp.]|jgi:formylglycine-generating enzyme required for sulfatase activity|nr:formylglycine-generating enzyme family protein [Desulfotignum sp.]